MSEQQTRVLAILSEYAQGQISRRQAMQLISALGIAASTGALVGYDQTSAQDASTPAPAMAPPLGPQEDGSNVWKVVVGGMEMSTPMVDLQGFFPASITINAGDSVYWEFTPMGVPAFHTVTFTSGGELPALFVPDIVDGTPVASPQGPPRLILNPAMAFPDGRVEYDGTGMVNSGVDILRTPETPPYVVKFTTPGTYEYVCVPHAAVMKGTIIVQEAGAALPVDLAGTEAMAQEEQAAMAALGLAAIDEANAAAPMTEDGAAWDVSVGVGGLTGARVMGMLPHTVTIKVGDTVRWTNRSPGEPHTITFLGGTEQPEDIAIEPQEGGPPKIIQSYTTLQPTPETEFDGNGYRNSGFMGLPPEVNEILGLIGDTYQLTFTAAGEYSYYCVLHASGPDDAMGMAGKVIVEA